MKLQELLTIHGNIDWRDADKAVDVSGIFSDSRQVQKNSVYVAIRGEKSDGHSFLADVNKNNAAAIVVEDVKAVPDYFRGAVVEVLDSRLALQLLTQNFYEHPGQHLLSVAVTGTNGKTSFCYIFEHLMNVLGHPCGVIGTIDHHLGDQVWETSLTTPGPVEMQKRLHEFKLLGAQAFVVEASSHALKQGRLNQGFDICVFTNLSRDHMDYHQDEEDYFRSKAKLFSKQFYKEGSDFFGLVNSDDDAGQQMGIISDRECFYFGKSAGADFRFRIKSDNLEGSEVSLTTPKKEKLIFKVPLIGEHNAYNAVAAVAAVYLLGLNWQKAAEGLSNFPGIPGRLQRVHNNKGVHAFVDFAHTDDALRRVLTSLREMAKQQESGRLYCVFGCGGDRDPGKRSFMGQVAADICRHIVVTSDNPRNEDPMKIINDITENIQLTENEYTIEPDRQKAIAKAVALCRAGDILLVAGKGHEKFQIIGDQKIPFDDYQVLAQELQNANNNN